MGKDGVGSGVAGADGVFVSSAWRGVLMSMTEPKKTSLIQWGVRWSHGVGRSLCNMFISDLN